MHMRRKLPLPVLLLTAVVGLYATSLHHPIFFDDIYLFNHNGLNKIFLQGFAFELRWLPYFLMAWIDLIFEDKIFAQRAINVGLHLATGLVLYSLVKQVSHRAAPHRNNERAALAAALLFLLHPLTVYAVGYLAQRTILMATLFGLLALNTYFDGLITRKKSYFLFSAFFYLLSAFSKEHAVLIPAAALALTPLAAPIARETWRQLTLPFALYVPIVALVVLKSLGVLGQSYEPVTEQLIYRDPGESRSMLWLLSAVTQAALFFKYLLLVLFPNPGWMSIDMRVPFAEHLWQPKYLLSVFALAAYGLTALAWLHSGGRRGLVGYALLAPLLMYAVEFSTVRLQEPFVLYRTYLWLPLLFMLIPALTHLMSGKMFWLTTLTCALIFAVASSNRLSSLSSEFAVWDDAVRKLPDKSAMGSARALSNRCNLNLRSGKLELAIADCTRAIKASPKYRLAYQNRAFAYMKHGQMQAAIADAKTVAQQYPQDPHSDTLLGAIYQGAGEFDKAQTYFEMGCKRQSIAACLELGVMKAKSADTRY